MGKRVTITEAVKETDLTEYTLRKGVKEGRFPHIRTGGNKGKILIDLSLLERCLEQTAMQNIGVDLSNVVDYGILRKVQP